MQKLYCYIDETGQDAGSEIFIVVAVVSEGDQNDKREKLLQIEKMAGTGRLKWRKSSHKRRMRYLKAVVQNKIGLGEVYFGKYKKPLPYFMPYVETIEKAIREKISGNYQSIIYIDGIDKKKAAELTNALRLRGIRLNFIKSRRDESEPLIRLADMWAGCIRDAFCDWEEAKALFDLAIKNEYLVWIGNKKSPK